MELGLPLLLKRRGHRSRTSRSGPCGCGRCSAPTLKVVLAVNEGGVVGEADVGGGRHQEDVIGRVGSGETADGDVRHGRGIFAVAAEDARENEAVGGALPEVALHEGALAVPRGTQPRFVDDVRTDDPGLADLRSITRAVALGRRQRNGRAAERAERVDGVVVVVEIAEVEGVLVVDAVVDARDVLAPVEGIESLEGGVVADGGVGVEAAPWMLALA